MSPDKSWPWQRYRKTPPIVIVSYAKQTHLSNNGSSLCFRLPKYGKSEILENIVGDALYVFPGFCGDEE